MEGSTVSGLRSRSRSKTPFLRSSCDHEHCTETEEHTHKSGRKTPIKRSTPVKQQQQTTTRSKTTTTTEVIREESEELVSPPTTRTRQSLKAAADLVKSSDYSSEESLDRLQGHRKEIFENEVNSQYERVSTTSRYQTLADLTLSPIHAANVTADRSTRFSSPAHSACSTDSSFAEQALADATCLLDRDPNREHLPYRLYKMAGEYWNKYPKTDYTYSPLSKDRVELAPGQVAVPNMSRRSLSQFRVQGPNTSADEVDVAAWTSSCRKRYTSIESSDDESYYRGNGGYAPAEQRWWLTRLLVAVVTTLTTVTTDTYRRVVGPPHRYPYTERRPQQAGIVSRSAAAVAAPFYWIYSAISSVLTTTVTTVTETLSPGAAAASGSKRSARRAAAEKRRWWPWLLLLLLPLLGYGSYYTYENLDTIAPNFTDFRLDLSEFTITFPNLTLPDINITLPDIRENLPEFPEVSKAYIEYRDIVQNRMSDASDYMKVVASSCLEELRRGWRGVLA